MTEPVTGPAIRALYAQVGAPAWARPNLDALADVLRDLSWLPEGPVAVFLPDNPVVARIVTRAVAETADGPRPVVLAGRPGQAGPESTEESS